MPKVKISEWSSTPANNTDIDSINIAEGCAPSGINDAIRELMAQVKDLYAGTSGDIIAVAAGGTGVGTSTGSGSNVLATAPSLSGVVINDGYTEEVYAVVDAAGVAISPTNGSIQTWTLGASRTPTAGTWAAGQSLTLMINDGTAYTVTWTTLGVTWVGGTAPTLATTGFTVIQLWKVGSTIYGALAGSVA